jgi:hypothetical protein
MSIKEELIQNGSLYIDILWVEKLEELVCRAHFRGRFQFGDLGSGTFQS